MVSRRDVLKAGFGLGGLSLTTVQASHPKTLTTELPASGLRALGMEVRREESSELLELRRFRTWMQKNLEPQTAAMVVPFATTPINFYVRATEKMLAAPEPRIPALHAYMTNYGETGLPQKAVRSLFVSPKGCEIVDKINLKSPDGKIRTTRVVTPCYTTDIEESTFSMRHTARILIEAAEGLSQECAHIIEPMANFKVQKCQITRPKVSVILEGFMLQVMAWVNVCAYGEMATVNNFKRTGKYLDGAT